MSLRMMLEMRLLATCTLEGLSQTLPVNMDDSRWRGLVAANKCLLLARTRGRFSNRSVEEALLGFR